MRLLRIMNYTAPKKLYQSTNLTHSANLTHPQKTADLLAYQVQYTKIKYTFANETIEIKVNGLSSSN